MSWTHRSAAVTLAIGLVPLAIAANANGQGLAAPEAARLHASLATGDRVDVLRADGGLFAGVLVGMNGDSLRVRAERAIVEIPIQDVAEVEKRGDSPWNGLLIGAVLGAAVGFGTYTDCEPVPPYKTCDGNLTTSRGMETLAAAALFGAVGLTVDVLRDGSRTVYRAAPARRGFRVNASATRVSAAYRIQF